MDKSYRSFVKAITWRITGSIDTFFLTFIVTNKFDFALSISFLEVFTKTLLFWVHERIWDRVRWGRKSSGFIELKVCINSSDADKGRGFLLNIKKSEIQYVFDINPGIIAIGHSAGDLSRELYVKGMTAKDLMKEIEHE
jgi:uncharacterized membrane protein